MKRWQKIIIPFLLGTLLLCVSSLLTFTGDIPYNLSWDEFEFAKLALSLDNTTYTPYSPLATGHSTLYFYILLFSLKIFGISSFALRLPSALFSLGSVLIFFFLMRTIFKKDSVAFVAAVVLLTARWFINFSRFSFEASFLLFLELVSLYLLLQAKEKRWWMVALAGLFAGLAFHSYTSGRIFFLVPVAYLLFTKQFKAMIVFLSTFTITVLPLASYLLFHPDPRINEVSLITQPIGFTEKVGVFLENTKKTIQMFVTEGDWNGRHNYPGKPAVNIILFTTMAVGFITALKNIRNAYTLLFAVYFLVSLIPSLFTVTEENPNMLRTFTILPSLFYFIALSLQTTFTLRSNLRQKAVITLLILLWLSALYELRTYFIFQSRVTRNSFELTCPLAEMVQYDRKSMPLKCIVRKNLF